MFISELSLNEKERCESVNKKYQFLSLILVIGYGFFFTTRLWNIDDRQRFNSWSVHTMGNNGGRVAVIQVVYVSPIDAIDIILEQTLFMSDYEMVLEAVVHRLDGISEIVPLTVKDKVTNINVTRKFLRIYLENENLDWHFVEIALVDEVTNDRSRLTMDWRMVERVDEVTTVASYDLSFDEIVSINESHDDLHSYHHLNLYHESDDLEHYDGYNPDLSLDGLTRSLDNAFIEYSIVSGLLELDPDDYIMNQSLAFYESEIQRLESLIEEYHDESN